MKGIKRGTVVGAVMIVLVAAVAASAAAAPLSVHSSPYLNFVLTPSEVTPLVHPSTAPPGTAAFASFTLVDRAQGIARYRILAPNLPAAEDGLYADLYWGVPGGPSYLIAGLQTTGNASGVVAAGRLDWDVLVWDIFAHPENYSVQLDDVAFPGPFALWPNYTGLLGGRMDNGFGI